MKIDTPKRFKKDKKSKEYRDWKTKEDEKYDKKVVNLLQDEWWDNLDNESKKELLKRYKTPEIAKIRRLRFANNIGSYKVFRV